MVAYLIIGIIVGIVEVISALVDLSELGLTTYDIYQSHWYKRKGFIKLGWILAVIWLTIIWPVQVYHWIRRIVKHNEVQETGGDSA